MRPRLFPSADGVTTFSQSGRKGRLSSWIALDQRAGICGSIQEAIAAKPPRRVYARVACISVDEELGRAAVRGCPGIALLSAHSIAFLSEIGRLCRDEVSQFLPRSIPAFIVSFFDPL